MQTKFDDINKLPPELKKKTASDLSIKDVVHVARTSTTNSDFFKPISDVRKLLHHVSRGEHDKVKALLEKDISLFYRKGQVTDYSGRTFESISDFEYALWALDKHMWTAILECVPKTEKGIGVLKILKGQYDNLEKNGVTYSLDGQTTTEQHFDFKNTIIKELQTQVDSINAPGAKNWDAIDNQWREGVGGVQKRLPMHIVDEYCSNEPFYPVPKFTSQPKSSKQFYNWTSGKDENWFSVDSKMSVDFAIYRGWGPVAGRARSRGARRGTGAALDLDAVTALCEVRTKDFIDLKSQLEDQMTLDNHHQLSHI